MRTAVALVLCFAGPVAAAIIGGFASATAPTFYRSLDQPFWAPPSWLFGPVWSFLYVTMGLAAFLVWQRRNSVDVRLALSLFALHLIVNALWSWLFFQWQLGAASVADIVLLAVMIVVLIVLFWRIRFSAALLLVPYLVWVLYATALNVTLWQRNPHILGN